MADASAHCPLRCATARTELLAATPHPTLTKVAGVKRWADMMCLCMAIINMMSCKACAGCLAEQCWRPEASIMQDPPELPPLPVEGTTTAA